MSKANHPTEVFQSVNLRREVLREQIADSIQEIIATSNFQPGTRLPPERELAKMLGVNRSTLREGISLLEQRGLVRMKVGSGIYVTEVPSSVVSESIKRYLTFSKGSLEDLLTLREILEPEVAAMAAINATPADQEELFEILKEMQASITMDDYIDFIDKDLSFHEAVARASHNELIAALSAGLHGVMKVLLVTLQAGKTLDGAIGNHPEVIEAIISRNPHRARSAMRLHVGEGRLILQKRVKVEIEPTVEIVEISTYEEQPLVPDLEQEAATGAVPAADGLSRDHQYDYSLIRR